jgi:hypothetical protein
MIFKAILICLVMFSSCKMAIKASGMKLDAGGANKTGQPPQ